VPPRQGASASTPCWRRSRREATAQAGPAIDKIDEKSKAIFTDRRALCYGAEKAHPTPSE
jgi:hypothetical protein